MELDIRKWIPWNWFKQEQETMPVRRSTQSELPARPADMFAGIHEEIDRLLQRMWQPLAWDDRWSVPALRHGGGVLKPHVDIKESKDRYVITVEVPGVDEDDVHVELNDRLLMIRGEKKHEATGDHETYHWVERAYGSFQRMLSLPDDANADAIEARFRRGVLTITLPRNERADDARRRSITVRSE